MRNEHTCEWNKNVYANRFLVERSLIRKSVSRKGKRTSPMKYCRWLEAFKGVSKRIYGSPLNPEEYVCPWESRGWWCTLRCVSQERGDESAYRLGFKFHFVKYFYPTYSRRGWMLQRRRVLIPIKRYENCTQSVQLSHISMCATGPTSIFAVLANEECQRTYSRTVKFCTQCVP